MPVTFELLGVGVAPGVDFGQEGKRAVRFSYTSSKKNIPTIGSSDFGHEFKPAFSEAGLFAHPELFEEVTKINKQIHELAPILNSPTVKDAVTVKSSDENAPIDAMVKRHDGATYVFAVTMRDAPAKGSFEERGVPEKAQAEVISSDSKIDVSGGRFEGAFPGYEVKLFKIR